MADGLSVDVRGFNRVANQFRTLAARFPTQVTEETREWGEDFAADLRGTPYPPPPAGSRYVRTYKLKRSWRAARINRGVRIVNNAGIRGRGPYATYVVGDLHGRQAEIHAGRWWRFKDKLKPALAKLRQRIVRRINKLAHGGL